MMCGYIVVSHWIVTLIVAFTLFSDGVSNPCPMLNLQVPEDTAIGTTLTSFDAPNSVSVAIQPSPSLEDLVERDGGPREEFLQLVPVSEEFYVVVLLRSIDLNSINTVPTPVPNTRENVNCSDNQNDNSNVQTIHSIDYSMTCRVQYPGHDRLIEVTSQIRIAIDPVNDLQPEFLCAPYYKDISELTPLTSTIFTLYGLAFDPDFDGAIAGYDLQTSDETFTMQGASSNGDIVVLRPLDYDLGPRTYDLNITTTDTGDPPLSGWTMLYITLIDEDDQNPAFSLGEYEITLPEQNSSIIGLSFATYPPVYAYDQDRSINADIEYEIENGHIYNGREYFTMDMSTGELIPLRELDRDRRAQFVLRVKAYQVDNPVVRTTYANLIVTVSVANLSPPYMTRSTYYESIPENSAPGYRVRQVRAEDPDQRDSELIYHLYDPTESFIIDSETGVITVSHTDLLDREIVETFTLIVYAVEGNTVEHYTSENSTVTVELVDVNDNNPIFVPSAFYHFTIERGLQTGDIIGQISASDADSGYNGEVRYSLLHSAIPDLFDLDSYSGEIRFEGRVFPGASHQLTVEAKDQPRIDSFTRTTVAIVNISREVNNLHPPVFTSFQRTLSLSEGTPISTIVYNIQATDDDGDTLSYSITGGDDLQQFFINPYSGILTTAKQLDRETLDTYTLNISVSDGLYNRAAEMRITILDVNDNRPEFSQQSYVYNITEEQGARYYISTLQATDRDIGQNGEFMFSIGEVWAQEIFSVDPLGGELFALENLDREFNGGTRHSFTVRCSDRGEPSLSSYTHVTVFVMDVNDWVPRFVERSYVVNVPERAEPQFLLTLQSTDLDTGMNAQTMYTLSTDTEYFTVDAVTGDLYTTEALRITQEVTSELTVDVTAYNTVPYVCDECSNDTVPVTVNIQDVNDNVPIFSQAFYSIQIYENQVVGSSVTRVLAQDSDHSQSNSIVTYWIQPLEGVISGQFVIEPSSGIIRLLRGLDRDEPSHHIAFILLVTASDLAPDYESLEVHNMTTLVNITILDVNDNVPMFSQDVYYYTIAENSDIGTTVTTEIIARDIDEGRNAQVTYSMQNLLLPFGVSSISGDLILTSHIDFDVGPRSYSFTVLATDKGQPQLTGSATVVIEILNINDNSPIFDSDQYSMSIPENSHNRTLIGSVHATDVDGDVLEYRVTEGQTELFEISPATGEIFSLVSLDFESSHQHTLQITVFEAGYTESSHETSVYVYITVLDINDQVPVFDRELYTASVQEYADNDTLIIVHATDADSGVNSQITYTILSGADYNVFDIDSLTGEISIVNGQLIDYNESPQIDLLIQAIDGGTPHLFSLCHLIIDVVDINNHIPEFGRPAYTASIQENMPLRTHVLTVQATDLDSSDTLSYYFEEFNGFFTVDSFTGKIATYRPLDREAHDNYTLLLGVTDEIHNSFVNITITVLDVNDNTPEFLNEPYLRSVSRDTSSGRTVFTVEAFDPDAGNNGFMSYWMGYSSDIFDMDTTRGTIYLNRGLYSQTEDSYEITIYVRDHGVPSRVAQTTLMIYVNDSNVYAPEFAQFVYDIDVPEDADVDRFITEFEVVDRDSGDAGRVTLTMTPLGDLNVTVPFRLYDDGTLYLEDYLDFETQQYYEFVIIASDHAIEPKSTTAYIHINVLDVNDNSPVFPPYPSELLYQSPVVEGQSLFPVVSSDADSVASGFGRITHEINSHEDRFHFLAGSAHVYTSRTLGVGEYNLVIRAKDGGDPYRYEDLHVTIRVVTFPEIVNYPLFRNYYHSAAYREDEDIPHTLIDLEAQLSFQANDDGVVYELLDTQSMEHYTVDRDSGVVTLVNRLNWSQNARHVLAVRASNQENPEYYTNTMIEVTIIDVNDHNPAFPFTIYTARVREDANAQEQVITISANDLDQTNNMFYVLESDNSDGLLRLYSANNMAVIEIGQELDRDRMDDELHGIYTLTVGVNDGYNFGSSCTVYVLVEDVNDNTPYFDNSAIYFYVSESAVVCQRVGQLSAYDPDLADIGELHYIASDGLYSTPFVLDYYTGVVSKNCDESMTLDREEEDRYEFVVKVVDTANHESSATVIIDIEDVNDNAPYFLEGYHINTTVQEGMYEAVDLVTLVATDEDTDDYLRFRWLHEESSDMFSFTDTPQHNQTLVDLYTISPLDRENPEFYRRDNEVYTRVLLLAMDSAEPPHTTTTTIDVYITDINDTPPEFDRDEYSVTISEGTPIGTPIMVATATDLDIVNEMPLTYSWYDEANSGTFNINSSTGVISVNTSLDISNQMTYRIRLQVYDGYYYTDSWLNVDIVDVNNHDPEFQEQTYYFSIEENDQNADVGQLVGQVIAIDEDRGYNSLVEYYISTSNVQDVFTITDRGSGNVTLFGIVDRETRSDYNFMITARDKGTPSRISTCEVQVGILDVNDNVPVFSSALYRAHIQEHSNIGSTILLYPYVHATDSDIGLNAVIVYSLQGPYSYLFDIDPVSGDLIVAQSDDLDREVVDVVVVEVIATDRAGRPEGLSSTASIHITLDDINDHAPEFQEVLYQLTIPEAALVNSYVGEIVATDSDTTPNNRLQYSIANGADGRFFINRDTGEIYVSGWLDRETEPSYILNISVTDQGVFPRPLQTTTLAHITVLDSNDNAPVFINLPETMELAENLTPPQVIGQVYAIDRDEGENARVSYTLVNYTDVFEILPDTGVLQSLVSLDREAVSHYTVTIEATDHGTPTAMTTRANLIIQITDVNDNSPMFQESVYSVNLGERASVNTIVIWLQATDLDEGRNADISYTLVGNGRANQYFDMDINTGLLTLSRTMLLSDLRSAGIVNSEDTLELVISATDHGVVPRSSDTRVIVTVEDSNTNVPEFIASSYQISIPEEPIAHTSVTQIRARSTEPGVMLYYSLMGSVHFNIDRNTGEITTSTERLDREVEPQHTFTVRVLDSMTPQHTAYTVVRVTLTDINDNPPHTEYPFYMFTIAESLYNMETEVGRIIATDPDEGENAEITMSIVEGNIGDVFTLDNQDGVLTVRGDIDRELWPEYQLIVQLSDNGSPSLTITVPVSVTISDVNDNAPTFEGQPYIISLENFSPSQQVFAVYAEDLDVGFSGSVVYELQGVFVEDLPFYVQTEDSIGIIYASRDLQYESATSYEFAVIAHDLGQPSLSSTASVYINATLPLVVPAPYFASSNYHVQVSADTPVDTVIFIATAGVHRYVYTITAGNSENLFTMHRQTGALVLRRGFQFFEEQQIYQLAIQVSDLSAEPRIDRAMLHILVTSGNTLPQFTERDYVVHISENELPPQFLIDIDTTEELLGVPVQYEIVQLNVDEPGNHIGRLKRNQGFDTDTIRIDNTTGRVWLLVSLDREEFAEFVIPVRCSWGSQVDSPYHQNRQNNGNPSDFAAETALQLLVDDVNDNPPYFVEDPVIIGIAEEIPFNTIIGHLQATDADSGNHSSIVYTILEVNSGLFSVEDKTGGVVTTSSFTTETGMTWMFRVNATDDYGRGYSDTARVLISVLDDDERVIMVARMPPLEFQQHVDKILTNLSSILELQVKKEKLEAHVDTNDDNSIDRTRTDMYFYAVDREKERIVKRDIVLAKLSSETRTTQEFYSEYNIEQIGPIRVQSESNSLSKSDIGLIVACLLLLVIIVLTIVLGFYFYKRRTKRVKSPPPSPSRIAPVYTTMASSMIGNKEKGGLINPVFIDGDPYTQPGTSDDTLSMSPSVEAATMAHYHPYHGTRSSYHIQHDEALLTDGTMVDMAGNSVIVLDNTISTQNPSDDSIWMESYTKPKDTKSYVGITKDVTILVRNTLSPAQCIYLNQYEFGETVL